MYSPFGSSRLPVISVASSSRRSGPFRDAALAVAGFWQPESTPELDRISREAAEAYPAQSGLQMFGLPQLYVKPDVLIV